MQKTTSGKSNLYNLGTFLFVQHDIIADKDKNMQIGNANVKDGNSLEGNRSQNGNMTIKSVYIFL